MLCTFCSINGIFGITFSSGSVRSFVYKMVCNLVVGVAHRWTEFSSSVGFTWTAIT